MGCMSMAVNSKQKGARFERELAKKFKEHGFEDSRRTAQYCGNTGDASDVVGLPGIHVEAKHQETMRLYDWIDQAKRDAESKETGVEKKIDTLSDTMKELTGKVDHLTEDVTELKDDLILLQHANEETVKYRELRDKQDKESIIVQQAIINSLMGILRERLVENYHRCQEKGYYSKEEREVYGKMYECYTQDPFNGNGVIHQLQPVMQSMPWTEEEAKRKNTSA